MGGGGIFGPMLGVIEERQQERRGQQEWNRENQIADLQQQLQQVRINAGQPGADQDALSKQAADIQTQIDQLYGQSGPRGRRHRHPMDEQLPAGVQIPGTPPYAPGVKVGGINVTPGITIDQVYQQIQQRQQPAPMSETGGVPQGMGLPGVPPWAMPRPAVPAGTTSAGAAPIATTDPAAARRLARLKATAVYPPASEMQDKIVGQPVKMADGSYRVAAVDARTGLPKTIALGPDYQPIDPTVDLVNSTRAAIKAADPSLTDQQVQEKLDEALPYILGEKKATGTTPRPAVQWGYDKSGNWYRAEIDPQTSQVLSTFPQRSAEEEEADPLTLLRPGWTYEKTRTGENKVTDTSTGKVYVFGTTSTTRPNLPAGAAGRAPTPSAVPGREPSRPTLQTRPSAAAPAAGPAGVIAQGAPRNVREVLQLDPQRVKDLEKDWNKAQVDAKTLEKRYGSMEKVAEKARHGDGAAQVTLISNYIKSVVSGQGVRVTQTEWNQAAGMRSWLKALQARFESGIFTKLVTPLDTTSGGQVDEMVNEIRNAWEEKRGLAQDFDQQIKDARAEARGGTQAPGSKGKLSRSEFKKRHPNEDVGAWEQKRKAEGYEITD